MTLTALRTMGGLSLCVVIAILSAFFDIGNSVAVIGVLTVLMLVVVPSPHNVSSSVVATFSGVTLFTMPYLGLYASGDPVSTAWFALYIIIAKCITHFSEDRKDSELNLHGSTTNFPAMLSMLTVGLLATYSFALDFLFYIAWSLALVHLERIAASTENKGARLGALALAYVALGVYTAFFWSGFGRLILVTLALGPLLLILRYDTLRVNIILLAVLAAPLSFVGRVVRFGWSDGLVGLAEDSGAGPLTLTETLWRSSATVIHQDPIWHQWSLLFLQWIPRALWSDKPIGLGAGIVDNYLGRQGLSEEHSFAVGYFGEHLYIAGNWWLLSVAVLTAVIIMVRRMVARIVQPYKAVPILFDAWLITLYWGGMAAFGARVWFSVLPMTLYILFLHRQSKKARAGLATAPAT